MEFAGKASISLYWKAVKWSFSSRRKYNTGANKQECKYKQEASAPVLARSLPSPSFGFSVISLKQHLDGAL